MSVSNENPEVLFLRALTDHSSGSAHLRMSYIQYNNLIADIKVAKLQTTTKTQRDYYLLRKFEVYDCGRTERLIMKRKSESSPILYVVPLEEIYSVLHKAHIETGHGGRDKMIHNINKKYGNNINKKV